MGEELGRVLDGIEDPPDDGALALEDGNREPEDMADETDMAELGRPLDAADAAEDIVDERPLCADDADDILEEPLEALLAEGQVVRNIWSVTGYMD